MCWAPSSHPACLLKPIYSPSAPLHPCCICTPAADSPLLPLPIRARRSGISAPAPQCSAPPQLLLGRQVRAPAAEVRDVLRADHGVRLAEEALDGGAVLEQHIAQAQRRLDAVAQEEPARGGARRVVGNTARPRSGAVCAALAPAGAGGAPPSVDRCFGQRRAARMGGPRTRLSRWGSPRARPRWRRRWWSPPAA